MTQASQQALEILRNPHLFSWYLVPLLAFVLYVYISEVEKRNWHTVLAGLVFFTAEFFWEILNALLFHFTGYAALWSAPADTAYLILIGLNIEIAMMFFVAGLIVIKSLPKDQKLKIFGLPNRLVVPVIWGLFCVFIEVLLNQWGALVWDYVWWSWPHVYLIILGYTLPFLAITWVYDRLSLRAKGITLGVFVGIDVTCWILFVKILHWM